MLSSVIKKTIQEKIRYMYRKLKQLGDEPYKEVVINELNLIFGNQNLSYTY